MYIQFKWLFKKELLGGFKGKDQILILDKYL